MTAHGKKTNHRQSLALALIGGGLLLLGIAALVSLLGSNPGARAGAAAVVIPAEVDFPAPQLELTDLQGAPVSLADFSGQVVLVNNWATWCPPCKAEIPALTRFYEKYKDRGFVLLGVMADEMTLPELEEFAKQYGLRYPVIKLDYEVGDHFGLPAGFPTTYVYDRTGHLRFEEKRAIREASFEKLLVELLAEPAG
jgi:thiol-disulfide isomerase/thioredoxin